MIPLIKASSDIEPTFWIIFPVATGLGVLLFSWLGIIVSNKAGLELPILDKIGAKEPLTQKDYKLLLNPMVVHPFLEL